jgi:hypothetical protein
MVSHQESQERRSVLRAKDVLPPEQMGLLPDVPVSLLTQALRVPHV